MLARMPRTQDFTRAHVPPAYTGRQTGLYMHTHASSNAILNAILNAVLMPFNAV